MSNIKDNNTDLDISAVMDGMVSDLKQRAAERWEFWDKTMEALDVESPAESLVLRTVKPLLVKNGVLIVKCDNSSVRFEAYRMQLILLEGLNKNLDKDKQLNRVVFR